MAQNFNDLYGKYGLTAYYDPTQNAARIHDSGAVSGVTGIRDVQDTQGFLNQYGSGYGTYNPGGGSVTSLGNIGSGSVGTLDNYLSGVASQYNSQQAQQQQVAQTNQYNSALATQPVGTQLQNPGNAPTVIGQGGTAMSVGAQAQQDQFKAGVANGTLKEIAPGQYVPVGSNAAKLSAGQLMTQSGVISDQQRPPNTAAQSATNLAEFYQALGQPLASMQDRAIKYQALTGKSGYQGTAAQNVELLNGLKAQNGMNVTGQAPGVGNTISAGNLGSKGPDIQSILQGMSTAAATGDLNGFVAGALAAFPQSGNEGVLDAITQRTSDLLGKQANKGADLIAERNKLGVDTQTQQLQQLNVQMATAKAKYDAINQAIENGSGTVGIAIGQQNQEAKAAAIEMGAISSMAQVVQGNIEMAKQLAQETIDMKYADQQAQIDQLNFLSQSIQGKMDRQSKVDAQNLQLYLQFRQESLDAKKTADAQDFQKEMTAIDHQNRLSEAAYQAKLQAPTGPTIDTKISDAFMKGDPAQVFSTVNTAYTNLNAVTKARDLATITSQINNGTIGDADSQTVLSALARLQRPDLSRLADNGDVLSSQSLSGIVTALGQKYLNDNQFTPKKLKEALDAADKIYNAQQASYSQYETNFRTQYSIPESYSLPKIGTYGQLNTTTNQPPNSTPTFPSGSSGTTSGTTSTGLGYTIIK